MSFIGCDSKPSLEQNFSSLVANDGSGPFENGTNFEHGSTLTIGYVGDHISVTVKFVEWFSILLGNDEFKSVF